MPRIQGLAETGVLSGNQLIKDGPGEVHSITVAWVGAVAGNILCYLKDAVTDAGPGTHELIVVADDVNGTWNKEWPQGKKFDTGIYYTEGSATNVYTEMTFK